MKRIMLILVTTSISFISLFGQAKSTSGYFKEGKVLEGLKIKSNILGYEVNYSIYLPPDYDLSNRSYPVVYLLHGFSDNENAWVQFGEVNLSADRAIANRDIPPMIIVMPDAKITWYLNDYLGKNRYEDMFIQEFIPAIESAYRIRQGKEFRAISGLSMGGFGALLYSLHHPDLFVACVAFSAGIFTDEEIKNMPDNVYKERFNGLFTGDNTNRLTDHWKKNNILDLVNTLKKEDIEKVRIMIDCGDDDFLYKGNSALHVALRDRNVYHEDRVRDGSHNWEYWRSGITDALKFIGANFHR
jgi:S-formylglutathione hydrolase FrmB